jgi:probable phosphoglycerate mutase
MTDVTHLILLRHGQTAWNVDRRIQGQIDTPLDAEGLRQARAAARRLADEVTGAARRLANEVAGAAACADRADGAPIGAVRHAVAVVSSDLLRCRQTAAPIADALGVDCAFDARLRERAFGAMEGRTPAEVRRDDPVRYERWRSRDPDDDLDGGESLRTFAARVGAGLAELAAAHVGRTLVLVTHGGALDVVHRLARGMPLEAPRDFDIPNAALNRLRWSAGRLELVAWADVAHWRDTLDEIRQP